MNIKSMLLAAFLLIPGTVFAQVIDTTALKQLKEGNYSFVEGRVQVVLSDTATPVFVSRDLENRGFEISSFSLEPVTAYAEGSVADSVVDYIRKLQPVQEVLEQQPVFGKEERARIQNNEQLSESRKQTIITEMEAAARTKKLQILFNYEVLPGEARQALSDIQGMNIQFRDGLPRSVIIRTEKGKEAEAMEQLDSLSYIKYTARIGLLNSD